MSAHVTLIAVEGPLVGRQFVFEDPAACVVGRAADCELRLPDDDCNRTVSRHHCLLKIDPPDVRVRDCGSRNGTYVNGVKIGQRGGDHRPEEARPAAAAEQRLEDGDELRLGDTAFNVRIFPAASGPHDKDFTGSGEEARRFEGQPAVLSS
jgi:pSer/pThr/pTyr-binding forkhead associated (FHA) protein